VVKSTLCAQSLTNVTVPSVAFAACVGVGVGVGFALGIPSSLMRPRSSQNAGAIASVTAISD